MTVRDKTSNRYDASSGRCTAGERGAEIYTLIANCRMHGVEPYAYLKDVLEQLPKATNQNVAGLTPLNWKKARAKSFSTAA